MADAALKELSARFERDVSPRRAGRRFRRRSLLRAMLLQVLYTIRSERMLMEQLDYNLLFRWFVGLEMDEAVWNTTVFIKNRERLLDGDIAQEFFKTCSRRRRSRSCCPMSISPSTAR